MYFFALPDELNEWLKSLCLTGDNWIYLWDLKSNVYTDVSNIGRVSGDDWPFINSMSRIQFFLGNKHLSVGPVMVTRENGRTEIDFLKSLCIQFDPCVIENDVLLEGTLLSFPYSKYKYLQNSDSFWKWRGRIHASMKREVFGMPAVITQKLTDDSIKIWKGTLVSPGAINWSSQGRKLKQFVNGTVEFMPKLLDDSSTLGNKNRSKSIP